MLRSCPGPGRFPGGTSSSPVTRTPARGARATRSVSRPAAAARTRSAGVRRRPAGRSEGARFVDLSAAAHVGARLRRGVQPHAASLDGSGVLDGDDRVASGRHRRARHDLPGRPGRERPRHGARSGGAGRREENGRPAHVRRAHGPSVHGRRVEARDRQVGPDVLGEDPRDGVLQRRPRRPEAAPPLRARGRGRRRTRSPRAC